MKNINRLRGRRSVEEKGKNVDIRSPPPARRKRKSEKKIKSDKPATCRGRGRRVGRKVEGKARRRYVKSRGGA